MVSIHIGIVFYCIVFDEIEIRKKVRKDKFIPTENEEKVRENVE